MNSSSLPSTDSPIDGDTHSDITATEWLWPGVERECCLCEHNKICYEGSRPCAGYGNVHDGCTIACAKEILAPGECVDDCCGCLHPRVMCNGERPSLNCRTNNFNCSCIDNSQTSSAKSLPAYAINNSEGPLLAGGHRGPQPQGSRTKIACFACRRSWIPSTNDVFDIDTFRRDSKKCEDLRPCSRCLSKKEECISLQRTQTIVKKRCLPCRMRNRKCEDRRPCVRCLEKGELCVDMERKRTGPGSRVKSACTNCKLKTQCDDGWPCKSCSRRKLNCDSQKSSNHFDFLATDASTGVLTSVGLDGMHYDHSESLVEGPSSRSLVNTNQKEFQPIPQALGYGLDAYMIFPASTCTSGVVPFPPAFVPSGFEDGAISTPNLNPNHSSPFSVPQADAQLQIHEPPPETAAELPTIEILTQPTGISGSGIHMQQFEAGHSFYSAFNIRQSQLDEYE